jgi:UDP-N-acetylmuramoyl-tripeptide--D-alanyl-D-alanine ligase
VYNVPDTHLINPDHLARITGGRLHPPVSPARRLQWDSRQVTPGDLFVALPGARIHGREFAHAALEAGAALVLTDQAHPGALQVPDPSQALVQLGAALRRDFPGTVLAVGGNTGKTTAKECLSQGLDWPAPVGNLNNAPGLAQFFWGLLPAPGCVVELGIDRLGEMAELLTLSQPQAGLLTALGAEHLDGLGSLEQAIAEETQLLEAVPLRLASQQAAQYLNLPHLHTYGLEEGRFQAIQLQATPQNSRFTYAGHRVFLPQPGLGSVLGATAALAMAELLGLPLPPVIERLSHLRLPPGRMQRLERNGRIFLNDAYNATPLSVQTGLRYLQGLTGSRWAVLGPMAELGPQSAQYHLEVARMAAPLAPQLIFFGPLAPQQAQQAGGIALPHREAVAGYLAEHTRPGDLIYLKASRSVGLEAILPEEAP